MLNTKYTYYLLHWFIFLMTIESFNMSLNVTGTLCKLRESDSDKIQYKL